MTGIIRVLDVNGVDVPINYFDLTTETYVFSKGGTLVLKNLDETIPCLSCTQEDCDELADVLALFYSSGDKSDSVAHLCEGHAKILEELAYNKHPYQIVH